MIPGITSNHKLDHLARIFVAGAAGELTQKLDQDDTRIGGYTTEEVESILERTFENLGRMLVEQYYNG